MISRLRIKFAIIEDIITLAKETGNIKLMYCNKYFDRIAKTTHRCTSHNIVIFKYGPLVGTKQFPELKGLV